MATIQLRMNPLLLREQRNIHIKEDVVMQVLYRKTVHWAPTTKASDHEEHIERTVSTSTQRMSTTKIPFQVPIYNPRAFHNVQ